MGKIFLIHKTKGFKMADGANLTFWIDICYYEVAPALSEDQYISDGGESDSEECVGQQRQLVLTVNHPSAFHCKYNSRLPYHLMIGSQGKESSSYLLVFIQFIIFHQQRGSQIESHNLLFIYYLFFILKTFTTSMHVSNCSIYGY